MAAAKSWGVGAKNVVRRDGFLPAAGFFGGMGRVLPAAPRFLGFTGGVGLSLLSYRSVSDAPVRGGTYFLCRRKESKQRKRASNRQPVGVHLSLHFGVVRARNRPSHTSPW
jgi:hypothetical protein